MTRHSIPQGGAFHSLTADMPLLLEIEQELGAVAPLLARLESGAWSAGEVVSLMHIFLQAAGREVDYMALGNEMLREGLAAHCRRVTAILQDMVRT